MEAFVKDLYEKLQLDLQAVNSDVNAVRGYNIKVELAENAIRELRSYFGQHPFRDKETEIAYFKSWAPCFFKIQILYTFLYNMEGSRITTANRDAFGEFIRSEIDSAHRFLKQHEELRIYYILAEANRDKDLFISTAPTKKEEFLTTDSLYCKNSILLAKIMACEEYLLALHSEIAKLEGSLGNGASASGSLRKYRLNLTKAQAAELIYAFVKSKCISVDGHDADIKDVVGLLKVVFEFEIDNIYDVELHNRKRKKDRAPFLTGLLQGYIRPEEQN